MALALVFVGLGLLSAGAVWLARGSDETSASGAIVSATSPPDDAPRFEPPAMPERVESGNTGEAARPAPAVPLKLAPSLDPPAAVPEQDPRIVRGLAVRASDRSPVASATITVLRTDEATGAETQLASAHSDAEGRFGLPLPRGSEDVRVQVPVPSGGPDRTVPVSVEWEERDPNREFMQLILDTGWRLDATVIDAAGAPRASVQVRAGGAAATTDAEGHCALLDLPNGSPMLDVSLWPPGAAAVVRAVPTPELGRLRSEATLTIP